MSSWKLAGRVIHKEAEIIVIFRVDDRYYPATEYNCKLFEIYLHTGVISHLDKLESEVQL